MFQNEPSRPYQCHTYLCPFCTSDCFKPFRKIPGLTTDEATGRADFGPSVCLRLTVMDHDLMSANDFEGECFLALRDLPVINKSENDAAVSGDLKLIDILDMPLSQPLEDGKLYCYSFKLFGTYKPNHMHFRFSNG